METPRQIRPQDLNLKPESMTLEGLKLLEGKINAKLEEIEVLGYQIISTEKEMGGDDEFENPVPEVRHGAYSVILKELKNKRNFLHTELKNLIREQIALEQSDKDTYDEGLMGLN